MMLAFAHGLLVAGGILTAWHLLAMKPASASPARSEPVAAAG